MTVEESIKAPLEKNKKPAKNGSVFDWVLPMFVVGGLAAGGYVWVQSGQEWDMPASTKEVPVVAKQTTLQNDVSKLALLQTGLNTANNRIEALETKIKELQKRPVVNISSSPEATATPTTPTDAANLASLQQQIIQLSERYDSLEEQTKSRITALSLLDNLSERLTQGTSYQDILAELQATGLVNSMSLSPLPLFAKEGAPTQAALLQSFHENILIAFPSAMDSNKQLSLGDNIRMRLGSILTIRRTNVATNDTSDEALLAKAESALQAGDISATLAQLRLLSETPRALFAKWEQQAESTLALQQALKRSRLAVLTSKGA